MVPYKHCDHLIDVIKSGVNYLNWYIKQILIILIKNGKMFIRTPDKVYMQMWFSDFL